MTIKVVLYGVLKKRIKSTNQDPGSLLKLKLNTKEKSYTIYDILKELDLKENEISHIFVNGNYCGMGTQLTDGDRVGLFPKEMALIFAEIEKNNAIQIRIRLPKNLQKKFQKSEAFLTIPKGSNLRYLLKKINLLKDLRDLQIFVNESEVQELIFILQEGDFVKIQYS